MLSPTTADTVSVDFGNGSTVEYTNELLEALRRLAVAGLVAFGRGGLEIGGVLYGRRDGGRLTIHGFGSLPASMRAVLASYYRKKIAKASPTSWKPQRDSKQSAGIAPIRAPICTWTPAISNCSTRCPPLDP